MLRFGPGAVWASGRKTLYKQARRPRPSARSGRRTAHSLLAITVATRIAAHPAPQNGDTTRSLLGALVVLRAADAAAVDLKSRADAAAASPAADECLPEKLARRPASWHHGAAGTLLLRLRWRRELDETCPRWKDYVSADGTRADKLDARPRDGPGETSRQRATGGHGSMTDWALDPGSGPARTATAGGRRRANRSAHTPYQSLGTASRCCDAADPNPFASWPTTPQSREHVGDMIKVVCEQ